MPIDKASVVLPGIADPVELYTLQQSDGIRARILTLGGAVAPGPAVTAPASTGLPDLLSPADAAQALGVTEEDVMAIITSGELQAKKIGASYRIRRAALQEYLEK